MAKKYLDSRIVDLPRSQWRYVQAAPARWLVLGLILSIIIISLWWSVAPQRNWRLLTPYSPQVCVEPEGDVDFCKTQ